MTLVILGVLDGGTVEPETRLEIQTDDNSTLYIRAVIRNGAVTLDTAEPIMFDGGDMMVAMEHVAKAEE